VRIRVGRKQDRNLYIQLGDEPSDDDEYLGVIFDPMRAAVLVEVLNGKRPPFVEREAA
jgi:hypothetical protein